MFVVHAGDSSVPIGSPLNWLAGVANPLKKFAATSQQSSVLLYFITDWFDTMLVGLLSFCVKWVDSVEKVEKVDASREKW